MSIKTIENNSTFTAVSLGSLDNLKNYSLPIPNGEIKGKVFLKDAISATGCEISINAVAPKTPAEFMHKHHQNEEVYIILKGQCSFIVDDKTLELKEGDVIRVATGAARAINNNSDAELTYMAIQIKENSLQQYSMGDADILPMK